ncbi:unnamed protein product [Gordionus sp. m RMFG-2023]
MAIIRISKKSSFIFLVCLVGVMEQKGYGRVLYNSNDGTVVSEEKCPILPQNKHCYCRVLETTTMVGQIKKNVKNFDLICEYMREQNNLLESMRILTETEPSHNITLFLIESRFDSITQYSSERGSKQQKPCNLQSLFLYHPLFKNITPDALEPFSQSLVSLSLIDNLYRPEMSGPKLGMIYEALKVLKNLVYLHLQIPEVSEFDASILDSFPKLSTLTLFLPNLEIIKNSKGFLALKNLKTLKFNNKLTYLPQSIVTLPRLENLYFQSGMLITLENTTLNEVGLEMRKLYLSKNHIEKIPTGTFQKIIKLEDLVLSGNQLESLPALCSPSHSSIDIAGGKKENMAEKNNSNSDKAVTEIRNIDNNLTFIDLSQNNFKDGSLTKDVFANCKVLKKILLNDNHLSKLPPDILDDSQNNLQELSFSQNNFKALPTALLSKLSNLTYLSFDKNEIRNVPIHAFRNNSKLQELYLSMNPLEEFDMKTLLPAKHSLYFLDLQYNHLKTFDFQSLQDFDNLTHLDLRFNNITNVKGLVDLELLNHHIYSISLQGSHAINYLSSIVVWYAMHPAQ